MSALQCGNGPTRLGPLAGATNRRKTTVEIEETTTLDSTLDPKKFVHFRLIK